MLINISILLPFFNEEKNIPLLNKEKIKNILIQKVYLQINTAYCDKIISNLNNTKSFFYLEQEF
jgi:hypothetical protein